MSVGVNRLV